MNPVEDNTAVIAEIRSLAEAVCTGSVTPEQCGRLNTLLLDENAALTYAVYIRMHGLLCWHWQDQIVIIETPDTPPPVQLPAGFLGGAWQGTVSYFSQIGPLSYLLAVAITGAMLLGFWAIKVTHHQHIAKAPAQSVPSEAMPEMVFVGRITGMVDVKWSDDPYYLPPLGAYVSLGRKYKLDSGLMEITYDSGAKVILEGPCTYEVESENGGYLALGKLTAKVEKERSEVRGQRSDHSPLSPLPSPLFSVRTPPAVVTDLGTEFGVEVDRSGVTESHVFRGSVKVQVVGGTGLASGTPREVILGENESARVQHGEDAENPLVIVRGLADPTAFSSVRPGQLAQVVQERQLEPFRRWQAFSEELRNRDDLLAYYDFQPDESDRLVLRNRAATGRQFDGRIEGGKWTSGRFPGKYALRFGWPGNFVRVNIPVECRRLTLAAWVKLDYLRYLSGLLMSDGWNIDGRDFVGRIAWQIDDGGRMSFCLDNWKNNTYSSPAFNNVGALGHWRHLTVVYVYGPEASRATFYFDGEHVGEGDMTAGVRPTMAAKLGPATIGAWDSRGADRPADAAGDGRSFRGAVDELMIFSEALSPEEIRRLFERGGASAVEKSAAAAAATEKKGEQPMNGP